jgi:hypothetical protein
LEDLRFPFLHLLRLGMIAIGAWVALQWVPLSSVSPWMAFAVSASLAAVAGGLAVLVGGRDLLPVPSDARRALRSVLQGGRIASSS